MITLKTIPACLHELMPPEQRWKFKLLQTWNTTFADLRVRAYIEKIYEDTIVIAVYDACWLHELHALSETLRARVNATLDKPYVKQIRFKRAGKPCIKKKNTLPPPPPHTHKPVTPLNTAEKHALARIHDPALAAALEAFLLRCYQERS